MFIPQSMLNRLYTIGSLKKSPEGVSFELKNRLKSASLTNIKSVKLQGKDVPSEHFSIKDKLAQILDLSGLSANHLALSLGDILTIDVKEAAIPVLDNNTPLRIEITLSLRPFGDVTIKVEDKVKQAQSDTQQMPRDPGQDFSAAIIGQRQAYVKEKTGGQFSRLFTTPDDCSVFQGNIEHLVGMAQVPVGIAGPMQVKGEHAKGEFYVPLATTEGTLVASYNRGMKLINQCGGVTVTVSDNAMQRAPVFVFDSAREARAFSAWVNDKLPSIRSEAEATDAFAKLRNIETYLANKFAFLRFNFETGDAAGQNMVGQATFAACNWILSQYPDIRNFYLESNMATDKKASQINILHSRGKRVTAEVTIPAHILSDVMHVSPKQMDYHARVSSVGAFMAGVNNTGLHAANGIAAMFIACGQDVANVSESSTGMFYTEMTDDGGLYLSLTLPSLIIATHGGGTGLPTQQECLGMLGCQGPNTAMKFAEIVAATAMAGEISLASAISSLDWVTSHEEYGRNR